VTTTGPVYTEIVPSLFLSSLPLATSGEEIDQEDNEAGNSHIDPFSASPHKLDTQTPLSINALFSSQPGAAADDPPAYRAILEKASNRLDDPTLLPELIEALEGDVELNGMKAKAHAVTPGGAMIYSELILRHLQTNSKQSTIPQVQRLIRARRALEASLQDGSQPDHDALRDRIDLVDLARVYLVASYAGRLPQQQIGPLDRALGQLERIRQKASPSPDGQTGFLSEMLSIEILCHKMELEGYRGNQKQKEQAKGELLAKIDCVKEWMLGHKEKPESNPGSDTVEVASRFLAESALLLMRMHFTRDALGIAQFLSTQFPNSRGGRRIASSAEFATRRASSGEIPDSSGKGASVPEMFHAIAHYQDTRSIGERAYFAGIGALTGALASTALLHDPHILAIAGGGAAAAAFFTGAVRLVNALRSDEIGQMRRGATFDRSAFEDCMRLIVAAIGDSTLGAVMAAVAFTTVTTGIPLIAEGLKGFVGYKNFGANLWKLTGARLWDGAAQSSSLDDAARFVKGLSNQGALFSVSLAWGIMSFGFYVAYMGGSDRLKQRLNNLGWLAIPAFLPGAVSMAYILRLVTMNQAHQSAALLESAAQTLQTIGERPLKDVADELWKNEAAAGIFIALCVFLERLLEMFTNGLISIPKSEAATFRERLEKAWPKFTKEFRTAHHFLPIVETMLVGISAAIGGLAQAPKGKARESLTVIELAMQSATTVVVLLGLTLLLSGVLKGKIPIVSTFRESLKDAEGQPWLIKLYEAFVNTLDLQERMYAVNRTLRSFTHDLPGAMARTKVTWNSPQGQLVMSIINSIYGNMAAAWTWTDTTGSVWGRNNLAKQWVASTNAHSRGDNNPFAGLRDYFYTAGQRIGMVHPLLPTAPEHRMLLGVAILKSFFKPNFPQMPNPHTFVDLYRLLTENGMNGSISEPLRKINEKRAKSDPPLPPLAADDLVEGMLAYVLHDAQDPAQYGTVRPVVITLAMARHQGIFAEKINAFFEEHGPWLGDIFNIDLVDLEFPTDADANLKTRALVTAIQRWTTLDATPLVNWLNPIDTESPAFQRRRYLRNAPGITLANSPVPELRRHRDREIRIKKHLKIALADYEPEIRFDTAMRGPFWRRAMRWLSSKFSKGSAGAGNDDRVPRFSAGLFAADSRYKK